MQAEAAHPVAIDTTYQPKNVVATFVDDYGDTRTVHRPKGRGVRVAKLGDTPVHRVNRAVAVLLGQNVRSRRNALGLTAKEMCQRAGLTTVNPKQYTYHIESAFRQEGVRLGTLMALAHALECQPGDLLPTTQAAMRAAGVSVALTRTLEAA